MGTHLIAHSESYPMNTNMTGFRWFSKSKCHYALDENSLIIGRVKIGNISKSMQQVKKVL